MKPFSSKSFNCSFNSFNSAGAIRYGGIEIGWVSGRRSIPNSISLSGGIPGNSSGNTSKNSLTTETDSIDEVLEFSSLTRKRWYIQPLEIILRAFKQEINLPLSSEVLPFHSRIGSLGN